MFQKGIFIVLAIVLLLPALVMGASHNDKIKIQFEDKYIDLDVDPIIIDGKIMIPIINVLEEFGYSITQHLESRTIYAQKEQSMITLQIDRDRAAVDGMTVDIDVPTRIINGETFVSVSFIAENTDKQVSWNSKEKIVVIKNDSEHDEHMEWLEWF